MTVHDGLDGFSKESFHRGDVCSCVMEDQGAPLSPPLNAVPCNVQTESRFDDTARARGMTWCVDDLQNPPVEGYPRSIREYDLRFNGVEACHVSRGYSGKPSCEVLCHLLRVSQVGLPIDVYSYFATRLFLDLGSPGAMVPVRMGEDKKGNLPRVLMAGYIDASGDSTLPASTRVRLSPTMRTELTK